MQEGSLFSTTPPALSICGLINDGHSDWCEVIPHGGFDLLFSNNQGCWALFHVLIGYLYILLGEMATQVFCPFSIGLLAFLLLICISCLYILDIYVFKYLLLYWSSKYRYWKHIYLQLALSSGIDDFIIRYCPSFSLVKIFILAYILSDISNSTSAFFSFPFA